MSKYGSVNEKNKKYFRHLKDLKTGSRHPKGTRVRIKLSGPYEGKEGEIVTVFEADHGDNHVYDVIIDSHRVMFLSSEVERIDNENS